MAEVKSTTRANEEKQLRLGLGQVLRYCYLLRGASLHPRAVLVTERKPSDPGWIDLARDLDVTLVWPGGFDRIDLS